MEAVEGGYQFDADFDISLNRKLEHALEKALCFISSPSSTSEFTLVLVRRKDSLEQGAGRLSYYALTRQYRLSAGAL